MNSLTTNLHLMMVSFYRPQSRRCRIVIESPPFPSDYYAVTSQIRFHGFDPAECLVEMSPRPGEDCLRDDDIVETLRAQGESVALVLFSGVHYRTGQLFDMARIVEVGHEIGATVGFDLAHAAGNVPLQLHDWNVDFAVWCSYKYLNGGPGAPGGCFVHERHAQAWNLPRFGGWWGTPRQSRFRMTEVFQPASGAAGWQLSNPPMLSMVALKAALDLFDEVGMPALHAKSEKLTTFLHSLLVTGEDLPYRVITPAQAARRGCQLSIRVSGDVSQLVDELAARGFVVDSRPPDVLRVAPVPFSSRFHDAWNFASVFRDLLDAG